LEKMLDEYPGYGKHVGLDPGERADRGAHERVVIQTRLVGTNGAWRRPRSVALRARLRICRAA
jgi:hypothetical protein